MSPQVAAAYEALHDFMYSTVYVDKTAKAEEQKVDKLLEDLYVYFRDNPCACRKIICTSSTKKGRTVP